MGACPPQTPASESVNGVDLVPGAIVSWLENKLLVGFVRAIIKSEDVESCFDVLPGIRVDSSWVLVSSAYDICLYRSGCASLNRILVGSITH